jgi:transposase
MLTAQCETLLICLVARPRNDAEAICEAASRPAMRSVAVKFADQQQILALHPVRDLLVKQRTAAINPNRKHEPGGD